MKTQTALVGDSEGNIILSHSAPVPELEDDRVFVEVKAVALNPVDTKMVGAYHTPGAISGCDFAGVVTAVGSTAAAVGHIQVGDRVAGAVSGLNPLRPDVGAFANYCTTPYWACLKLPPAWSIADGASLGMTWTTVWNALFRSLGLPFPGVGEVEVEVQSQSQSQPGRSNNASRKVTTVLVNGGSSSAGTCALQLLKLAGYQTVATCSPRNFELARSFGADYVFDYNSPSCADDIRALTRNSLRHALDCIARTDSTRLCFGALARAGGRYTSLNPFSEAVAATRKAVRCDWVMGPEMIGEEVRWPEPHGRPANPGLKVSAAEWVRMLQMLLDRNLLRTHPLLVRDSGLEGVLEGFVDLRAKRISGQKLIYLLK
ncbi:Enoyl reductase LovC [Venustampulla echinocandica]|uniref:Enoyl reductase LovC n=1 Tax=Venustampulla echinocandica TaxID=2656787 RepID=A0A370T9S3_9HELO|nr:Enoyl reductase LovC [Venustampulla echinocandica]RDL30414.1 Enoyl reductase LovC [Venustampulla echinocandica]